MNKHIISVVFLCFVGLLLVKAQDNSTVELYPEGDDLLNNLFQKFKKNFNRAFNDPVENAKRLQIFKENVKKITQLNRAFLNGTIFFHQRINQHADKTPQEFLGWLKQGLKASDLPTAAIKKRTIKKRESLPSIVDHRIFLPPVKDQKQCGACWAFSAISTIEYQYNKAKAPFFRSFSEQQLVDCVYPRSGCTGGFPATGLESLYKNGISSSNQYPYGSYPIASTANVTCKYKDGNGFATVKSIKSITMGSESSVMSALASSGVISIAIDASTMQFYAGGIFTGQGCSSNPNNANHAVSLVGYTPKYFIMRNSWGTNWGEQGNMRIARGSNYCGVANWAYSTSINILK